VGWVNSNSQMEIREIEGVSTDTITLKHALSAAPVATDEIYNATTYYPDPNIATQPDSMQLMVQGAEGDDRYRLSGGQVTALNFTTQMGAIPMVEVTMTFADWDYVGGGSLAAVTYANHTPISFNAGELLIQQVATATRNIVQVQSIAWQVALTHIPVPSPDGVETLAKWLQEHTPPFARVTPTLYYEDQTYYTGWANRTKYHVALQISRSASGGWLLVVPTGQVELPQAPQDKGGVLGYDVPVAALLDEDATDQSTTIRRAPFRAHCVG